MSKFCDRLKQLRIDNNMTQKQLGHKLNYGSSAIANYESGRNQPNIEDLIKLAKTLHVIVDYLVGVSEIHLMRGKAYKKLILVTKRIYYINRIKK